MPTRTWIPERLGEQGPGEQGTGAWGTSMSGGVGMSPTQLRSALVQCEAMPFGPESMLEAERLVGEADRLGDPELQVLARVVAISAYAYGGEPPKIYSPFAWVLSAWDNNPQAFTTSTRHHFLWQFKWVTVNLTDYPQVPLAQIRGALADMKDRYERAGEGQAPYEKCRFTVTGHVHGAGHADTLAAYERWVALPRTSLSDCAGCEPAGRVRHLAALGRHEDAVAVAWPVLDSSRCREQPQGIIDVVLTSLLVTGRPAEAAVAHSRAVRLHRRVDADRAILTHQILASAQVGRLTRALDLLTLNLHLVDSGRVPESRMRLAAAGARVLSGLAAAGLGDEPVASRRPDGRFAVPRAASEVLGELTDIAVDLAVRFDERNGTTAVSRAVQEILTAPELPSVPSWPGTGRLDRTVTSSFAVPGPPSPTLPLEQRLDAVLALREHAGMSGEHAAWQAFAVQWPEVREELESAGAGLLAARRQEIALVDVAYLMHVLWPSPGGAADSSRAAVELGLAVDMLHSVGLDTEADLLEEQRLAVQLDAGQVTGEQALRRSADLAEQVQHSGSPAQCARAYAHLAHIATAVVANLDGPGGQDDVDEDAGDPTGDATGEDAEEARSVGVWAAARAAQLFEALDPATLTGRERSLYAGIVLSRAEELEAEPALDVVARVLELLPPGVRADARGRALYVRGIRLAWLDELDAAVGTLREAAEEAVRAGEDWGAVSALATAGSAVAEARRPAEAVPLLQEALERGARLTDTPLWRLRSQLVHALLDAGQVLDAADLADNTEDLLRTYPPSAADPESAFHAGRLAFGGALALRRLEEPAAAARLALAAADAHSYHDVPMARAEALDVAAMCTSDATERVRLYQEALAEADAGQEDPWFVASLRRRLADAVEDADGPDAALAIIEGARAELSALEVSEDEEPLRAWHLTALAHFTAGVLMRAERYEAALDVIAGVVADYAELGDDDNAAGAVCLQAAALHAVGRPEDGIALAREAAEEALTRGEREQSERIGTTLARLLDETGDPEAADRAWTRYRQS